MNLQPLLDALDLQEDAARALADDLRTQIDGLQTRLREAEMHLEHLAITRTTVTGLADRLPNVAPDRYGPRTSAKPSATNCCQRTSKAPAPS
ncbi:hypothetical protein [Streptomyces sp. NEAU-W12]|uniref:hypothetical protein n=1 Tax=Streptomyces sp. NEAU-W12 TaxID=2994668 RepID=UPI00224B5F55|nr:hypothetical protein [Streptomyces sp. NEAU-W12]MCX2927884.1 hypothetical protein [Streptomyces sp. NEAU-W12]